MWDRLIGEVQEKLPKFNNYLIYEFRKQKLDEIELYLDSVLRQSMEFFGHQMRYVGYRTLTPEERIEYIVSNPILKGGIPIRPSDVKVLRYEFEFNGMPHYMYMHVPYLMHDRVLYNGTEYYPQFPVVERGGINRTDSGSIIVKVMRVPIPFGRRESDKCKVRAVSGKHYWDIVVTAKIYMGTRGGKKTERIPLMLYHLCKYGFPMTMTKYKFVPGEIEIVGKVPADYVIPKVAHCSVTPDGAIDCGKEYFQLKNGLFLGVNRSSLKDMYKRRVVLSLIRIFTENPNFKISDVISADPSYYKVTLGKYICAGDTRTNILLYNNAEKHLRMTDPLLDSVAKTQLANVGITVGDIYDMLLWMFYNIDDLLVTYDPTNLYDKKLGSLDQIMSWVVRDIAHRQYRIINGKQEELTQKVVAKFVRSASQQAAWIGKTSVFRPAPTLYNDNYLLSIGLKRFLSLESVETSSIRSGRKATKVPVSLIKAHPSQLAITSILDIPSSSPVATGSMNPFVQIDKDGNIQIPEYSGEIEHIFK